MSASPCSRWLRILAMAALARIAAGGLRKRHGQARVGLAAHAGLWRQDRFILRGGLPVAFFKASCPRGES